MKALAKTLVLAIGVAASTISGGPAVAQEDTPATRVVEDDWWFAGARWNNGLNGIEMALFPYAAEDETLVLCGALQFLGAQGGRTAQVSRAYRLKVDNRMAVRGFHWMPIITRGTPLVGSTAKCQAYPKTKVPTNARFSLDIAQRRF